MQLEQVRVPSTDLQQSIAGAAFDDFTGFQDIDMVRHPQRQLQPHIFCGSHLDLPMPY